MKIIKEITTEIPEEVVYLDYLTLDPTKIEGKIVLSAKSKIFANWIKSIANGPPVRSAKWGGSYYPLTPGIPGPPYWVEGVGNENLMRPTPDGPAINLGWLRHAKLAEGIEIAFEPNFSFADYEDFMPTAIDLLTDLYMKFIRVEIMSLRLKEVL
jgi:hypothetical protein